MLEVIQFVNSRFNSNTFIISHPNHEDVWVVDPGDTTAVYEWMKSHQKNSITGVLLTHAHFDHIYGLNEIVSRFPSCIVYIANEYGLDALHNPKVNGSKYTEEGPIEILEDTKLEFLGNTMLLWDDVVMKTINTPGHSDDAVCFIIDGMLFSGDTLIKDVRTVTKLKTGSVEKLKDSLKFLSGLKGNNYKIMPGHDDCFLLDEYDMTRSLVGMKLE